MKNQVLDSNTYKLDLLCDIKESIVLRPHEEVKISTGLGFSLLKNKNCLKIESLDEIKDSNFSSYLNCDCTGELQISILNTGEEDYVIYPCDRVTQLNLDKVLAVKINI